MNPNQQSDSLKPDSTRYYDAFADSGFYDKDAEGAGWPTQAEALIARAFEAKPAGTVRTALDLGAGTGIVTDAIMKFAQPKRLVAVDASSRMLALLQQKYAASEKPAATIDVETDTIQHYVAESEETFDFIMSLSVLEFLPNLPFTLRQVARLLNENGIFAFTYVPQAEGEPPEKLIDDTAKIHASMIEYHWPSAEAEQALTDSGLTVVDRVDAVTAQEAKTLEYNFIVAEKPPAQLKPGILPR